MEPEPSLNKQEITHHQQSQSVAGPDTVKKTMMKGPDFSDTIIVTEQLAPLSGDGQKTGIVHVTIIISSTLSTDP